VADIGEQQDEMIESGQLSIDSDGHIDESDTASLSANSIAISCLPNR
jgi:hypothetical protein